MGIAICSSETLIPAICTVPSAQGKENPRGSLPKVNSTVLSATMPSATVAISQALEPRRANGRTATSTTTTPYSAHSASASSAAGMNGQPSVTAKVYANTAPSIIELPCAKFTVLDTANVT